MPKVNPQIIKWARETAGLTVESAAKKLGINDARHVSGTARLAALEQGSAEPSRPLLLRMSKLYRRSLLVFYLSSPPRKGDRGNDYRTLPEGFSTAENALLDVLIRDVRARQSMVRAALEGEDEGERLPFIGSMSINDGAESVVRSIREIANVSLEDFRRQQSPEAAFSWLREKIEAKGIFVLLISNLGSHHTTIHPEIFRGIALADEVAPFIVVNDQDAKSAWSFTLLHEVAHLWLGQTGVSGGFSEIATEQFCNEVASNFLLPADELQQLQISRRMSFQDALSVISQFARERNLSSSMVAYGLYKSGGVDREMWQRMRDEFREQWLIWRRQNRERARAKNGGPDYFVVKRNHVGSALIGFVRRMVSGGALTTTKAGVVLGVRPKNVQSMIDFDVRRIA